MTRESRVAIRFDWCVFSLKSNNGDKNMMFFLDGTEMGILFVERDTKEFR